MANQGYKVANIPFVLNQNLDLSNISKKTLVIGLFAAEGYSKLELQITFFKRKRSTNYIDIDMLKIEVEEAKKFAQKTIGRLLMLRKNL